MCIHPQVRYNPILCMVILAIWSWSLLQFTMVLTATKVRKDQSGLLPRAFNQYDDTCCTPDVYGIIISIFMQDAPFLVLRLLLIFYYGVLSYTNMFFTCKNTLVILLLLYRLIVIQIERHKPKAHTHPSEEYMRLSESGSRSRLMVHSNSTDQYYNYRTKVKLREPQEDPNEPMVDYIIKRRLSFSPIGVPLGDEEAKEGMLTQKQVSAEEEEGQEEEAFLGSECNDPVTESLDLGDITLDICDNGHVIERVNKKPSLPSNHVNQDDSVSAV